jgi:hypothetical protein
MLRYSPVAVAHHIRGENAVYASEHNGDNVYDTPANANTTTQLGFLIALPAGIILIMVLCLIV